MKKNRITTPCAGCGKPFERPMSRAAYQHCSRACRTNVDRKIDKFGPDGCWVWLAGDDGQKGYGRVKVNGVQVAAHRYVYELHKGKIPKGLEIDHLCRNVKCVNPEHLEPVTRRENVLRAPTVIAARTATHCKRGHEWTAENTYYLRTGTRTCRKCGCIAQKSYRERKMLNDLHR